jgi:hypothetical protein
LTFHAYVEGARDLKRSIGHCGTTRDGLHSVVKAVFAQPTNSFTHGDAAQGFRATAMHALVQVGLQQVETAAE